MLLHGILNFYHLQIYLHTINLNQVTVPPTKRGKIGLIPGVVKFNTATTLNKFEVTNCSMRKISSYEIDLTLELQRLPFPIWMSLFIPSICLIVAAEITLFIDEIHFKATITVALTSNLVMYTLYNGIQEKLPEVSSLKLIDIWLLHGLLMPMVVFVILATNELIIESKTPKPNGTKVANSVTVTSKGSVDETDDTSTRSKTCMLICKTAVPAISFIFILTFFFVMYSKQHF